MKIRAKVSCDASQANAIATEVKDKSSNFNIIKNGIIVDPYCENNVYTIPDAIKNENFILLIDVTENGGKCENAKPFAQVVTGMSSKALKPYFIPRKNVKPCGHHAYFSIPESCVVIQATEDEYVKIIKLTILNQVTENGTATLEFSELYSGSVDSIDEENIRFKQAAQVAIDKFNCEDCTHTHFYNDRNTFKQYQQPQKNAA